MVFVSVIENARQAEEAAKFVAGAEQARLVEEITRFVADNPRLDLREVLSKEGSERFGALFVTRSVREKYWGYGMTLALGHRVGLDEHALPEDGPPGLEQTETSELSFRKEMLKVFVFLKGPVSPATNLRFVPQSLRCQDSIRSAMGVIGMAGDTFLKEIYVDRLLPILFDWCQEPGFLGVDIHKESSRLNHWQECLVSGPQLLVWWLEPLIGTLNFRYLLQLGNADDQQEVFKHQLLIYLAVRMCKLVDRLYVAVTCDSRYPPRWHTQQDQDHDHGIYHEHLHGMSKFYRETGTVDEDVEVSRYSVPVRLWPSYQTLVPVHKLHDRGV
ncbi:hypothetical protein MBM_00021 [Drepanopeziza brunnea f. sp. 'multigermtubi' MB_m1]|uniref:Uncharacterized protein n=1 Tax=Marssonina brunnea f. sp. multigermtubi (strain MB_m1) TaxID=1072389 RepID=K1XJP0_MARBU|nr:uncharacterized protein MBM_00021 [Drepanopeziza brunnea f. sp. 'multigermtubi' MB_m1]EKD20908.1 hypothetical protein MBM_00021 [Drepanopeziza brunnea f. sp. 'multigermtubi' MB_m1]